MPADGKLAARSTRGFRLVPLQGLLGDNLAQFTGAPYPPNGGPGTVLVSHGRDPRCVKLGPAAMAAPMSGLPESSRRADIRTESRHCNPAIAAVRLTDSMEYEPRAPSSLSRP